MTLLYGTYSEASGMGQRAVDRAAGDLRRGDPVLVLDAAGRTILAVPVESATPETLQWIKELTGSAPLLALSGRRATHLGLDTPDHAPLLLAADEPDTQEALFALPDPACLVARSILERIRVQQVDKDSAEAAALTLCKIARLLPAVFLAPLSLTEAEFGLLARQHDLLIVQAANVQSHRLQQAMALRPVSEAEVPLEKSQHTRLVAFRPADGGLEHIAILIGNPDPAAPVLTRIHSECFTGDLLGSLRCDCGPQLQGSIAEIARQGSGVVLYLAQEGRGVGLVNKLRAYRLQDTGVDTLDANEQLGFEADERIFLPAAEMLRQLGFSRVRLMTNNPEKLRELQHWGIEVVERVPHIFPGNGHNEQYLRTKAERAGHMF